MLMGLLGTVIGLINAFAAVSNVNPAEKTSLLSASISVAMNNTALGLGLAITLLLAHMELMASHDFHTALQNYLDLEDLRVRLVSWQTSFDAFDDIIALRKQNYEPLLPGIDAQFRDLDAQIRLRMRTTGATSTSTTRQKCSVT